MPFQPGAPRPANAGRKAGTPNKRTQEVDRRLADLDCEPVEVLVAIIKSPESDNHLRAHCAISLLAYKYPKLKAIEHTLPEDDLVARWNAAGDLLDAIDLKQGMSLPRHLPTGTDPLELIIQHFKLD